MNPNPDLSQLVGNLKGSHQTHSAAQPQCEWEELLTRRKVAQILGVCEHTVARDKRLSPVVFNSRRLRYRRSDVNALIDAASAKKGGAR